jgi:hypothetical protein
MMNTNRRILLVEDDDLDAELASRAFQRAKVTTCRCLSCSISTFLRAAGSKF